MNAKFLAGVAILWVAFFSVYLTLTGNVVEIGETTMTFEEIHPISEKQVYSSNLPSIFSNSSDKKLLTYILASIFLVCAAILIYLGEKKYISENINTKEHKKRKKK